MNYFVTVCGVKPDAHILDVGCGAGRIVVPLTRYLHEDGSYEGLDIIPQAIARCSRKVTAKYQNFHFQLADVANKAYNPNGAISASEFTFPYDDASFDFVFLVSVFTHMSPQDLEHYLSEIARVLKTRGKSFITYFLLTPETLDHIEQGESIWPFEHEGNGFKTVSETLPESSVAYDESYIKGLYDQNCLTITRIRYGTWSCFNSHFESKDFVIGTQDFVIAEKN